MTKPGEQPPSNFDARADNAALALRKTLQRQGRQVADSAPVEVGPDGREPPAPPPQGSYAAQALELQRRQAAAQRKQIGDQPPAGTPEQALDGSVAPPVSGGQPPVEPEPATSPRAEKRIQELVEQLRVLDQKHQQAVEDGKKASESANQYQQRLAALEQQHAQMLQANLDNLDPETRMQVMQDARMSQRLDEFEQRIVGRLQPQLRSLENAQARNQMQELAGKYPAFDIQIHGPLIDMFRGKNPHCSIEQAFRAIAQAEELVTRQAAVRRAVPFVAPPGNGELAAARYAPTPEAAPSARAPEAELVEESRRVAALLRDTDPAKRKEGMRQMDEHLKRRLS